MLEFQTAQDRILLFKKINALITGPQGIGKTFVARTLDPETTLFIDCEAGTLSLERSKDQPAWQGTTLSLKAMAQKLNVHPWVLCRGIASILLGADTQDPNGYYGKAWYDYYVGAFAGGNPQLFDKFRNLFVDSLTVVSRWAFDWACQQPESISEKTKKLDKRGAYGLMGTELVAWATALQHQPKNIFLSCILEEDEDDFKRKYWQLQIEGKQAGKKIPGIFDLVMSLAWVDFGETAGKHRVFVTQEGNALGFPAKDRSGLLEPYERPDLGAIINKIQNFHTQPQA